MEKTKLLELLKSLSKTDMGKLYEFAKWISSDSKDENNPISEEIALLDLLIKKVRSSPDESIKKDFVLKKLTPNYPGIEQRFNYLTSNLLDWTNKYLVLKLMDTDEPTAGIHLLRYYLDNGLEKNYKGLVTKMKRNLEAKDQRSNEFHLHLYNLHQLEIIRNKDNRRTPLSLDLIDEHLNFFFIENKLRLACEYVSRKNIINTEPDSETVEFLMKKQTSFKEDDAVKVYTWIYKMLNGRSSGTSEQYYVKIDSYLKPNSSLFVPLVKKVIYEYLMNECINQVNVGNINYAEKYVQHIEQLIGAKRLLINDKIGHIRYRNTVSMALMDINRINWVEQFIKRYHKKIDSPDAKNIHLFSQAQLSMAKANYDEAYKTLNQYFTPHDFYHKIGYEKMLAKIYYSIKDYESIKSRLKTFRRYVERQQKLPKNKKEALFTFIEAIRKLVQHTEEKSIEDFDMESFQKRLTSTDYLWFKQTLDRKQSK